MSTSAEPAPPAINELNPTRWVEDHGDILFRYALGRVGNDTIAEDLVQDTFLAALRGAHSFAGAAAERTWLTGILRHKVLDYYRRAGRETTFTDLDFFEKGEENAYQQEGVFEGWWNHRVGPKAWSEVDVSLNREEFWEVFNQCSAQLTPQVARVFLLREVDGLSCPEICDLLKLTQASLYVMIHRARMALRRCLELHWFATA